jgi:hypothetical protein
MKKYKLEEVNGVVQVTLDPIGERHDVIKYYKENALIFGEAQSDIKLTDMDLKLFDLFYKVTQDKVRQEKEPPIRHLMLDINQSVIKEYLKLNRNDWKQDIKDSLIRLSKVQYIIRNYVHPDLGRIEFYIMNLLAFPKMKKIDNTGRNDVLSVVIPDLIVLSSWRKLKYTHLQLEVINKFTSKHTIRLYQYIQAIRQYQENKNRFDNKISINFEELKIIFEKPKAQYLSKLLQSIKFDTIIMRELQKEYKCWYDVHNRDRMIYIDFDKAPPKDKIS